MRSNDRKLMKRKVLVLACVLAELHSAYVQHACCSQQHTAHFCCWCAKL